MSTIKSFSDFVKETEFVGTGTTATGAVSEELCNKLKECMEMAERECTAFHEDDNAEHTADGYLTECDAYMKECMEGVKAACEGLMNTPDAPDGNMRQGNTQDMN
jgi:hypothetical protein